MLAAQGKNRYRSIADPPTRRCPHAKTHHAPGRHEPRRPPVRKRLWIVRRNCKNSSKTNPDLLPVDDLAMSGPLAVIGRETRLSSGAVDLVALSRSGDLLVVEFKTGPQNPDFRAALAQLMDYGSDIWGQSFETFERSVPLRYFASEHCHDPALKSARSLREALGHTWPDLTDEEFSALVDNLMAQISRGMMHYLLLAQRFSTQILRTIDYLNQVAKPRFYAIEVVRFQGEAAEAFESRLVQRPRAPGSTSPGVAQTRTEFLAQFDGAPHEEAIRELLDELDALGYTVFRGTIGVSIRVPVPDRSEPLSVAWVYPPGRQGWLGLTDLTVGYDPTTTDSLPLATPAVERFFKRVTEVLGHSPERKGPLHIVHLDPDEIATHRHAVIDLLRGVRDELDRA